MNILKDILGRNVRELRNVLKGQLILQLVIHNARALTRKIICRYDYMAGNMEDIPLLWMKLLRQKQLARKGSMLQMGKSLQREVRHP